MKNKIFKYKFETLIFIIESICMTLELVASRVLSPYFGNSNVVWTSVIGIILLSSSIGNYLGGKIADGKENEKKLKLIIILASIYIFTIPIIQEDIIQITSKIVKDIRIGAIISTVTIFFIPSLLLGTIIPIILKIKIKDLENIGKVSGRIYAISTIGGIFGTFLSGFVLIPNFGSIQILFVLSIILALLSIIAYTKIDKITIICVTAIIIADSTLCIHYTNNNITKGALVLDGNTNTKVSIDTQYGRVIIYNTTRNGKTVRMLNIDGGYESATYIDEDEVNELVFKYTQYYNLMFRSQNDIQDVLLIGGAGYSYPKYYISHYENKKMDVVEIDGEITEVAKKYFYLDKLIDDYNLNENHRLNLITQDGRSYLNNNTKKYDAILNDAFSGENPEKTLTTLEAVNEIKKSLNDGGVYLSNIVATLEGERSRFLRAEVNTLKQVFKNVYVIPVGEDGNEQTRQNVMVISTDQDIEFENVYELGLTQDEITLTDNYCPSLMENY